MQNISKKEMRQDLKSGARSLNPTSPTYTEQEELIDFLQEMNIPYEMVRGGIEIAQGHTDEKRFHKLITKRWKKYTNAKVKALSAKPVKCAQMLTTLLSNINNNPIAPVISKKMKKKLRKLQASGYMNYVLNN